MRLMNAFLPIVSAFFCGLEIPELAWAIDTGQGIHSATDLWRWIAVPVFAISALAGGWRAYRASAPKAA